MDTKLKMTELDSQTFSGIYRMPCGLHASWLMICFRGAECIIYDSRTAYGNHSTVSYVFCATQLSHLLH